MNALKKRRILGDIPSQRHVAEILGVKPNAVCKWENGTAKPRIEKLPALAKLYGCTVADLLEDLNIHNDDGTQETWKRRRWS